MSYMSDEISGGSVSFMLGEEKVPKPEAYPPRLIQLPLSPLNLSFLRKSELDSLVFDGSDTE